MNEGPGRPGDPSETTESLDDSTLGALVRDVARDWEMPPQRLGQRTWRDRVGERHDRRPGRGVARQLIAAAGMAIAATIVLAVAAVWLNDRGRPPVAGASPSAATGPSGSPGASLAPSPSATPYPTLLTAGQWDPPAPFPVAVDGRPTMLDLSTGMLGTSVETGNGGRLLATSRGDVCLCVTADATTPGGLATTVTVDLVRLDAAAAETSRRYVATYAGGVVDPATASDLGDPVQVLVSSAGPGRAYVGWSIHGATAWTSGVDAVDLASGSVIGSARLPDLPLVDEPSGQHTFAWAPWVYPSPDGTSIVVWQPHGASQGNPGTTRQIPLAPDHWSAPVTTDGIGALTAFATGPGTTDPAYCPYAYDEGFAGSDVFVATCASVGVVRRVDLAGRGLGDVAIDGLTAQSFASQVTAPAGIRYVWMPYQRTLTRVDLGAGRVTGRLTVPAPTAAVPGALSDDPLAAAAGALGRWLAPAVSAKLYLQPALALSPDGSRLYLLATTDSTPYEAGAGSAGVVVVDTATMSVLATWPPTADYDSIGVSADGRYVFAAGAPGAVSTGSSNGPPASVTVFDATTGSVAAIAGQLGGGTVLFDPALLP